MWKYFKKTLRVPFSTALCKPLRAEKLDFLLAQEMVVIAIVGGGERVLAKRLAIVDAMRTTPYLTNNPKGKDGHRCR